MRPINIAPSIHANYIQTTKDYALLKDRIGHVIWNNIYSPIHLCLRISLRKINFK